ENRVPSAGLRSQTVLQIRFSRSRSRTSSLGHLVGWKCGEATSRVLGGVGLRAHIWNTALADATSDLTTPPIFTAVRAMNASRTRRSGSSNSDTFRRRLD